MTYLDLSSTDIAARIQANLIAYMRLFADLPGVTVQDSPDLFWIISGSGAPGNGIFLSRWPEEQAEQRIDMLFDKVGQQIDSIDWMRFPGDRPVDLGNRLEARGMPATRGGNWLWMDLDALGPAPAWPVDLRIEQVRDDRQLREWVDISEAGFGSALPLFYVAYARHGYGAEASSLHYTGYINGAAVATATLLEAGGTAAIYDLSVPPVWRRRGASSALTYALLQEIQRRGYCETWIWSSNMAVPVYRKLGFVDADFGIREHGWRREQEDAVRCSESGRRIALLKEKAVSL